MEKQSNKVGLCRIVALGSVFLLAVGCGSLAPQATPAPSTPVATALDPAMSAPPPAMGARTADTLDTTTPEQRVAALAVPEASGKELGRVAVSLGNAADPGFWLRTSLVAAPAKGRVVTESGMSVQVDLRPGTGAAQLSLGGFRALGLGLTDLPQVTVFSE